MNKNKLINFFIALVWLINGLFCKVLHFVPRHQQIVSRVLSEEYGSIFTIIIGVLEIFMAVWILSGYKSKLNAVTQITIVIFMNIIELLIVSDVLLWGKFNIIFALFFAVLIYYNEFIIKRKVCLCH